MYIITKSMSNQNLMFLTVERREFVSEPVKLTVAKEFLTDWKPDKGSLIGDEDLAELKNADRLTFAVLKAIDALSYGNHSRRSLINKLRLKYKIEKEYAESAADYAVNRGYIDEPAQAAREADIAVRTKGRGKRRIAADLSAKGYSREAIAFALDGIDDRVCYEALVNALRKKIKKPVRDRKEYIKLAASMARLGHSRSDIERAFCEFFSND